MPVPKILYIATTNHGKLQEYMQLLPDISCNFKQDNLSSPIENGSTFIENALIKAKYYSQKLRTAVLADDSGLVVPTLKGLPGVKSARFAGINATEHSNINKLLSLLNNKSEPIHAYFYCAIVIMRDHDDPAPLIGTGQLNGFIIKDPIGNNGFGYDSIFYLPELNKTLAQLSTLEKNLIIHRDLALK